MTPPARRRGHDDVARRTAYDVVLSVEVDEAYANLVLPAMLRERRLDERDAAFATELTYGTLRWQGCLDEVVAAAAGRPVGRLDPPVRAVLRLGAYQLLHMRVAAHGAVHATVDLARSVGGERVVGLVNAVLRRTAERDWAGWVDRLAPTSEPGRTAFAAGYPEWVAVALLDALDGDRVELAAALATDRPVTHLVARPGRIDRAELLAQAGRDATAGPWSPYAVRLSGGDPARIAAVTDRRAGVQDEGSQLAALALARAPLDGPDGNWLDACAGPGGKAALLAGVMPAGGRLVAAELQPHRARLVRAAASGRGATSTAGSEVVVVADATAPAWRHDVFDRVLVDAPCSGLGALRRRPEVRWRRTPADVERLQHLQLRLLDAAVASCREGGVVAYVTCSPHPTETRAVVARILRTRDDVEQLDARPLVAPVPDVGPGPDVQLWPHRHGTDAMYIAVLRRTAASTRPPP